jgi:S-adenosylmethionine synthetase
LARRLFTSESVTEGHPDKMADQISDAILDAMIKDDPGSRVAVETLITTGQVHVAGEVTTRTYVDIPGIIREKILQIGYDSSAKGYDGASCGVSVSIGSQSPDIAQGVNDAFEHREDGRTDEYDLQGAGDQGLMFGYACRETPELMPLPIMMAHKLARRLSEVRRSGQVPYLRPDGKTQVTVEYVEGRPVRLDTVVVSTQHAPDINLKELLAPDVKDYVVEPVLGEFGIDATGYRLLVNPTGRFEIGGPMGDAGLTGRKIIIDTYGGAARHGGGAFSGKDPSKVDRSAAYAMRWVAKNVVAAGLADRCEAQVAYAIGKAAPVGLFVECFGTETVPVEKIQDAVTQVFDLRPKAIINSLDLLRPIFGQTAAFGHFGRTEPDFTWERTDRAEALRSVVLSGGQTNPSLLNGGLPRCSLHLAKAEVRKRATPPAGGPRGSLRLATTGQSGFPGGTGDPQAQCPSSPLANSGALTGRGKSNENMAFLPKIGRKATVFAFHNLQAPPDYRRVDAELLRLLCGWAQSRCVHSLCLGVVQMRMNLRMRMVVLNPMPMHVHAICCSVSAVPRQPPGAGAHRRPTSSARRARRRC